MNISRYMLRYYRIRSEEKRIDIQISAVLNLDEFLPRELCFTANKNFVYLMLEVSKYVHR